mgnify:CR=1 FL=1
MFSAYLDDSDLVLDLEFDIGVLVAHDGCWSCCVVLSLSLSNQVLVPWLSWSVQY